uniref:Uncharacterized protein n=1 Tax=Trichuris muris TaxID=70415 RepID=A0A5S6QDC5_TRIMR
MVTKYRAVKQFGRFNTRKFKALYRAWLREPMPPFEIPAGVKALNVKIHDPNLLECPEPRSDPLTPVTDVPTEMCFTFDGTESLAEGANQALHLIKAVGHVGLPQMLMDKLSDVQFGDLEADMTKFIMQAYQWDSTLTKLPVRRDPTFWWYRWPRYYGIPSVRKSSILLDNFFRHSLVLAKLNGGFASPRCFRNAIIKQFVKKDGDLLCFTSKPYVALWAKSLLPPLSDASEVAETRNEKLASVHPVHPIVDLRKEFISEALSVYPAIHSCFAAIHTTFVIKDVDHRYPWTKNELAGNAILSCFANALAISNELYGVSVDVLPTPIVCQCVQCCENNFDFLLLQLNTTNISGNDGVKNIVWHDTGNRLFDAPPYWENVEDVKGLNPDVFKKFIALMLHSAKNE